MSDLDSFFAKKDKKKCKKGKKYTTTDEIAKRLEDTEKKSEKSIIAAANEHAKREEQIQAEANLKNGLSENAPTDEVVLDTKVEEEQWNDFKDETTIDVSDLKITKLNIEEEEDGKGDCKDDGGADTDQDKKDGVWKVEESKSIQSTILEAVDSNNMENLKATVAHMANSNRWNSQNKEMVPSALPRGGSSNQSRRKKTAPDINNAMSFPSLADARNAERNKKNNKMPNDNFSGNSTHHSSSSSSVLSSHAPGAYRPPMFRTANKFEALTDHSNRYN